MAGFTQKTRVLINGKDISPYDFQCSAPRYSETGGLVDLTVGVGWLEVEDGALIIHIDIPEE